MALRRLKTTWIGIAIALAGLVPNGTFAASGKGGALGRFIAPDFCAALVIHPEQIKNSKLVAAFQSGVPKELTASANDPSAMLGMLKAQNKLPPGVDFVKLGQLLQGKSVRRVVVLIEPNGASGGSAAGPASQASFGAVVQFSQDIEGEAILGALSKDWQPGETAGTKYQKIAGKDAQTPTLAVYVADARTIVVGVESSVIKMLAKRSGPQPLLEQLQHTNLKNDIIAELLVAPLAAKFGAAAGNPAESGMDAAAAGAPNPAAMAKGVQSVSLTLNLQGEGLLHAEIVTKKPETAAMFTMLATGGLAAGKQQFENFKKEPPAMIPTPVVPLLSKLGDEIFAGLKITSDGPRLVVELPTPPSLPEVLKMAGQMSGALAAQQAAAAKKP